MSAAAGRLRTVATTTTILTAAVERRPSRNKADFKGSEKLGNQNGYERRTD